MTYLYPTASTVAVFLNGYHVEQAYQLQFKESFSKAPIYGYNDFTYSKVAMGRKIVQGVLVVNFLFAGYLNTILDAKFNDKSANVAKLYNEDYYQNKGDNKEQLTQTIKQQLQTELPPNSSAEERSARASYIASLISNDKDTKEATQAALERSFIYPDPQFKRYIPSPLDVDTNGATLDIYYQDPTHSTWFTRFNNVFFNEVSQVMSQAGAEGSSDPLYEIYSFIASDRIIKLIK